MEENTILVSISCTTYNHSSFIERTLNGFLMQKTTFKYEILIHDDASTDGTDEIIKKFEKQYPDIIKPIYQKENQYHKNINITRTFQYPRAKGKYIAICEGDDYWIDSLKLQKQIDFLEYHDDYCLCANNAFIMLNDKTDACIFNHFPKSKEIKIADIVENWIIPTASIVIKKVILDKLPEWTSKMFNGDMTVTIFAATCGRIYMMSDIMCVYNYSTSNDSFSSIMKNKQIQALDNQIIMYKNFDEFTSFKYTNVFSKKIKDLKYKKRYMKILKTSRILSIILYPQHYINIASALFSKRNFIN